MGALHDMLGGLVEGRHLVCRVLCAGHGVRARTNDLGLRSPPGDLARKDEFGLCAALRDGQPQASAFVGEQCSM